MTVENKNLIRSRKRGWRTVMTVLASIVVFVTTYALIIPAITWEKTLICPLEEHLHTDFCYNSKGELKCGKEEHQHTDACFDAIPTIASPYRCGLAEHHHTDACYFDDGTLKCTIPEHTHTAACLKISKTTLVKAPLFGATPEGITETADPSTKDIIEQFKIGGEFTAAYDGKVVMDKTVEWDDSTEVFNITLSALGQSFNEQLVETETLHPDIVFVVDISTSMVSNKMKDSNDTRMAGVVDSLNYAIDELLKNDPETRIGIVTYSNYAWDGTNGNAKHLYLPLDYYDKRNKDYITIDSTTSTDTGSVHVGFNSNWTKSTEKYGANQYVDRTGTQTTTAIRNTYTQDGLMAGMRMLVNATDKNLREPVLILISDGEPGHWRSSEDNTGTRNGGTNGNYHAQAGYWTIRTAMYVKEQIHTAYYNAQTSGEDVGILFYSMGPGVWRPYGQAVLSPGSEFNGTDDDGNPITGKTNLEVCSENNDAGKNYSGEDLYRYLTEGDTSLGIPALTAEQMHYVDFADWSLSGELTPTELEEGMRQIVNSLKMIPRPIVSTATTEVAKDVIDTDSFVTFSDTLGKGMTITGTPVLVYNGAERLPVGTTTGTLADGLYKGCNYTLYEYSGKVTEPSTGHIVDLSEVRLYVVEKTDGTKVVEWQFPAGLLPIIYHDFGTDPGPEDDRFYEAQPVRALFNVVVDGVTEPGVLYKTNSTDDVTTARFKLTEENPYASGEGFNATKNKSDNTTKTEPYVASYAKDYTSSGKYVDVLLGNNGILKNNLFTLEVEKIWEGGTPDPADIPNLTITLYANGAVNDTRTLDAAHDWKASFGEKQAFDVNGDPIVYTVEEERLADYYLDSVERETTIRTESKVIVPAHYESEHWSSDVNINALENGKTYRLITSDGKALQNNGTDNNASNLNLATKSDTATNQRWELTYTTNGYGRKQWRIRNVSTERNVYFWNNSFYPALTEYNTLTIESSGKIRAGSNQYLQVGAKSGSTTVNYTNDSSKATVFSFQELIPAGTVPDQYGDVDITVSTFTLTNKKLPDSLPAEKIWGLGTAGREKPITLSLYEKDGSIVTKIGELELNAGNDWKGDMDLTDCDNRKDYYVAENGTDEFMISYPDAAVESIFYDGESFPAIKVDFASTVKFTAKNERLREMPSTGGIGAETLYALGAGLLAGAIMSEILRRKRGRRGDA